MADALPTVTLTLSAHHDGKQPGEQITAEPAEAKRLIRGGIAVPSTVPDAKAAGVPSDEAATKR